MFKITNRSKRSKIISRQKEIDEQTIVQEIIHSTKDELEEINNLNDFYEYIKNFDSPLKKNAKNTVIYDGIPSSPLMIIGDVPGEDEDIEAKPFVGEIGKLLTAMLKAINIERSKTYITNFIYWKLENNRTPTKEEVEKCLPLLKKHIDIINPKVILILGSTALNALFSDLKITNVRGKTIYYKSHAIIATFHPSYILKLQKQKLLVWEDLQKLEILLKSMNLMNEICK